MWRGRQGCGAAYGTQDQTLQGRAYLEALASDVDNARPLW
jgi:hypothetical protein